MPHIAKFKLNCSSVFVKLPETILVWMISGQNWLTFRRNNWSPKFSIADFLMHVYQSNNEVFGSTEPGFEPQAPKLEILTKFAIVKYLTIISFLSSCQSELGKWYRDQTADIRGTWGRHPSARLSGQGQSDRRENAMDENQEGRSTGSHLRGQL